MVALKPSSSGMVLQVLRTLRSQHLQPTSTPNLLLNGRRVTHPSPSCPLTPLSDPSSFLIQMRHWLVCSCKVHRLRVSSRRRRLLSSLSRSREVPRPKILRRLLPKPNSLQLAPLTAGTTLSTSWAPRCAQICLTCLPSCWHDMMTGLGWLRRISRLSTLFARQCQRCCSLKGMCNHL